MPEVRALQAFVDRREHKVRNVGDKWFCDDDRARQLASFEMAEILGVPADEPKDEPKPKRTKKKAE